ncbi:MAG: hypothetical protein CM15mP117_04160 [Alphaproteobacteria bacterium]|nr:MAG: hypothetical protein CM15mP117_04160 [Alphaproteobacteria bacterium]
MSVFDKDLLDTGLAKRKATLGEKIRRTKFS